MPYHKTETANLYYETWGTQGAWLTLLTGTSRTLNDFRGMVRVLGKKFRLLSLDNRGAGRTESEGDFTLAQAGQDVIHLWNHLEITKSHLLGMSYGGVICLSVLEQAAEKIEKLILVSTSPHSKWIQPSLNDHPFDRFFSNHYIQKNSLMVRALSQEMAKGFTDPNAQSKRSFKGML